MTAKKPRKKIQPAGRKRRFTKDQVETAIIESGGCKIAAARALGCSRTTLDSYISRYPKLGEVYRDLVDANLDEIEQVVFKKAKAGNLSAAFFVLRTQGRHRGYVEAFPQSVNEKMSPDAQKIMADFRDGNISASRAALDLEILGIALPESIKILLAKEQPEPVDPSGGAYCVMTDEEMERRVAERKKAQDAQREQLSTRRAEMHELHKEMADSFAAGATPRASTPAAEEDA